MDLKNLQKIAEEFDRKRNWHKFRASNVFVHLVEELGEIGRHISFEEGYKKEGFGNSPNINREELKREFAQVFKLFVQLANHYLIDLEKALVEELEIMKKRFKQ